MSSWYAITVAPRTERCVQDELKAHGIPVFLPLEVRWAKGTRRLEKLKSPVFPSYVFVDMSGGRFHTVRTAPNVRGFVLFAGLPAAIPTKFIDRLKRMEAEHLFDKTWKPPAHQLKQRDRVRFRSGPFGDMLGQIERLDGKSRVRVLLTIFGRPQIIKAEAHEVEYLPDCDRAAA